MGVSLSKTFGAYKLGMSDLGRDEGSKMKQIAYVY